MNTADTTIYICANQKYEDMKNYLSTQEDQKDLLASYKAIFEGDTSQIQCDDERIKELLVLYESYLKWAFTHDTTIESCKAYILETFQQVFPKIATYDELEEEVKAYFENFGYHFILGVTAPYVDLYLWKQQKKEVRHVELLEHSVEMNVYEMSEVITGGWFDYFSLHTAGTGGWVSDDGAYYFASKYDVTSDDFNVSLLKHEGQHFYDFQTYGEMDSISLEYRAKLIELIYHSTSKRLNVLLKTCAENKENPHAYSNMMIIKELSKRIFHKDFEEDETLWKEHYEEVRSLAKELLKEDTETRNKH